MKTGFTIRGLAGGLSLILALPVLARGDRAPSPVPQDETKLAEDLQGLVRQLREERTAFYARHHAREEEIDRARSPVRRLELELAGLRSRESDTDKKLADVRSELEKLRGEQASDRLRDQILPELDKSLREGREFVSQGLPYRLEDRTGRLGPSESGSLSDKMSRYWSFLQEEARVARSGEALSMEVPLSGGRRKPARVFRVGHLVMGYVTEDGLEVGLWNGKEWASAASPEEERTIRQAIEILDRRRTPDLLSVPVLRRGAP